MSKQKGAPPKLRMSRRPKNLAEGMCFDKLKEAGWTVSKRGWPDFFAMRPDGEICLIEVKPNPKFALKDAQHIVLYKLAEYGIPCYRYDPINGLTVIDPIKAFHD